MRVPVALSGRAPIKLALLGLVLTAGLWWWLSGAEPAAAYRTQPVDTGEIRVAISATGSLKAISTVEIGSQISGQVVSVEVDFNDLVQAGQAIAHIDPAPLRTRLTQAEANLASARAGLSEARAALTNAEADYARKLELAQRRLVSQSEVDLALAARDQARARIESAEAAVKQAEAATASARLDLDYTVIRAPVDGIVIERAVEPGQTVAASFQTPKLFQIAEDLSKMQIDLSIDETDVGRIREGQAVSFTVDAYPERRFQGTVHQVRLASAAVQNVVTYPVVVRVDNPDGALLPGMTANAEIEVERRPEVPRIPNAALRFRPPEAASEARTAGPAGMRLDIGETEIAELVAGLDLNPAEREAFERVQAARRELARQRPPGPPQGAAAAAAAAAGGVMMISSGGGVSPEAIRRMVGRRLLEGYAEFLALLDPERREHFERGFMALVEARRGSVWVLEKGRPAERRVRLGLSDSSHTELLGGLAVGEEVIVGTAQVGQ